MKKSFQNDKKKQFLAKKKYFLLFDKRKLTFLEISSSSFFFFACVFSHGKKINGNFHAEVSAREPRLDKSSGNIFRNPSAVHLPLISLCLPMFGEKEFQLRKSIRRNEFMSPKIYFSHSKT